MSITLKTKYTSLAPALRSDSGPLQVPLHIGDDPRRRIAQHARRQPLQVRPGQVDLEDGENVGLDERRNRLDAGIGDRLRGRLSQDQERQCGRNRCHEGSPESWHGHLARGML